MYCQSIITAYFIYKHRLLFSLIAQLHHIPDIEQIKTKRDLNKAF